MNIHDIPAAALKELKDGTAIPAMPLALNANRSFDLRRQKALVRYYLDAGAGGLAVGVHTTQFAIHEAKVGLYKPVLGAVAETMNEKEKNTGPVHIRIAGICGPSKQAAGEATLAAELGYHAGLLNLAALSKATVDELIEHCRLVAEALPIFGFYLQPGIGGRELPLEFWRGFFDIENVLAVKIATFDRYRTLEVVRALAESGRADDVVLYTGNDDNIIADLVTKFSVHDGKKFSDIRIKGGLLGHWAVWTKKAVTQLKHIKSHLNGTGPAAGELLTLGAQVTEANTAIFDALNGFAGCIPGIHEVLRLQGLFEGTWCLNPEETLSPGQAQRIGRIIKNYNHLVDDDFVKEHLDEWLRG